MRIIHTDEINPKTITPQDKLALYNGLDCLICREVFDTIFPLLDETSLVTYNFMLALQAPILEMQLRGCLIDEFERREKIRLLERDLQQLEHILNTYAMALWEAPLNARSPKQKAEFLYGFAQLQPIRKFDWKKGESKITTDRAAIEKLDAKYEKIRPITRCLLAISDISKQLGTLRTQIDPDGYFRAAFHIAGTETGRLSSKKNAFGRGANMQNINERLRSIFTAPEGPIPNRDSYDIPQET